MTAGFGAFPGASAFEKLFTEAGYRKLACTSIPLRAAQSGGLDIPAFIVKYALGTLRNGYCIWKFGPQKLDAPLSH